MSEFKYDNFVSPLPKLEGRSNGWGVIFVPQERRLLMKSYWLGEFTNPDMDKGLQYELFSISGHVKKPELIKKWLLSKEDLLLQFAEGHSVTNDQGCLTREGLEAFLEFEDLFEKEVSKDSLR